VFLAPYYDADIASGRTTEREFREQLKHFLWQWGSIANYWNQPVGLGGTRADGTSEFNHVSRIVLDVIDSCALATPKLLVKIAPNTPDWAMDKMLDMARRRRSISFVGEEPTAKALKKWYGASDEDCRTMVVKGCYEFSPRDCVNDTGIGHVNLLRPIELMLAEARGEKWDMGNGTWAKFDDFKTEYLRRITDVTCRARKVAFELEKVLSEVNPADCMTLATEYALKTRKDAFANGCPRGNNSTILAVGVGTAVDALLAVKELVYEKRELSLAELGEIMAADWQGHEKTRLRMLRSNRKWGNNDPEANAFGAELIDCFASQVNGKPNSRGGVFLASGHCARQFIYLGTKSRPADTAWQDYSGAVFGDTNGIEMVNYGMQFVGNPYRYGGTSLTNGTDCSGFIYSVYRHFGYNVPRLGFYKMGKGVCLAEAKPGDVVYYPGHYAMYAGDGKIVHAYNSRRGICVTSVHAPGRILTIRRFVEEPVE
jgi:cell wall-associated NlpC family hydrolase